MKHEPEIIEAGDLFDLFFLDTDDPRVFEHIGIPEIVTGEWEFNKRLSGHLYEVSWPEHCLTNSRYNSDCSAKGIHNDDLPHKRPE